MRLFAVIPGLALILIILWDAFETIILPRRVTRRLRLTGLFYQTMWSICSSLVRAMHNRKRREKYLGTFGPLSLLMLLTLWAVGLIAGYATLHWGLETRLNLPVETGNFATYLYISGETFFTLGYGDIVPALALGRAIAVIEAANGFGLLAIVIGYLPVLYGAFSRREVNIALLDARAGSPSSAAEMLRRHGESGHLHDLTSVLHEWEHWSAELLESHLSYPVLCYFRSQHDNQSWLGSMTTILDTCALVMVGVGDTPAWQARLTFAMARHAVVDLAQIFRTAPAKPNAELCRLAPGELERIREILAKNNTHLRDGAEAEAKLAELRSMYEPYVCALSEMLLMPLPPWIVGSEAIDNWKTSAWGRIQ
ncbi:MAG TPA: potassium channel family protein [Pyrinomonadaceae bacterium]|jgi:predicted membrane protein|nr:potassium channel family protein [Pyrinomonadaceae bacterium]